MNEDKIVNLVAGMLKDSVSWSNSNIAGKQEIALKYYKRAYLPGDDKIKGRSKFVSSEVQQRVDWMTASLIRIFDAPENVCEFVPFGSEDEPLAKQQTDVTNWVIKTKNSHLSFLQPWLQNGLLTGLGIVTVEYATTMDESLPRLFKGVPNEQLLLFNAQEEQGAIVIDSVSKPYENPLYPGVELRDLKVRTIRKNQSFNILPVAPEDFIVSKDAQFDAQTGGIAAKLQGHRKIVSKADLLEMGFDPAKVKSIPLASDKIDGIALVRSQDLDAEQGVGGDDVEVYQVYAKLKLDTKPRHYRLILAGDFNRPVLLDYEETSRYYPYCPFVPFPIANTLFGLGIPDKIGDDHILVTKMTRAMLDDLHNHVHPVKIVNPDTTNIEDLLNVHPGSVIRSTDPSGGISYNVPPFSGQAAMPVIQNVSQGLDFVTGVGPSMIAIDASDLQNTTATAVNQRANSSQLLVEMISRFFADTGYRYLVKVIIDTLAQKPEEAQEFVSRLTNAFIPVDEFTPEFDVSTSVSFGVMSRDQSTATLMNLLAQQMQMLQAGLPVVQPNHIYNTLAKVAETAGFKNTSLFFVDPSTLPPAPPAPPPPDPNAGLIEVEKAKAQLRAQSDDAQRQFEMQKFIAEQDFKRDQQAQELELKRAEIAAKYSAQVEIERLKMEQRLPRDPMGNVIVQEAIL